MNVSFDIDNALIESEQVRSLARFLAHIRRTLPKGHQLIHICMITDRPRDEWEHSLSLKQLMDRFGLSMNDVYFTDGKEKRELIDELEVDIHIDADAEAVAAINAVDMRAWLINYTNT